VCAVRLQFKIFWEGYIKKKKNIPFHRRVYRQHITRRYFTKSCKKITGFCHIHRRIADGVSDSNTDGITDGLSHACLTRVRLHEYRLHFRRPIPTALPTDHACLPCVRLHEYRRHCRRNIPTGLPTDHACLTRVRLHEYRRNGRRIEKFGGIFELFWCAF